MPSSGAANTIDELAAVARFPAKCTRKPRPSGRGMPSHSSAGSRPADLRLDAAAQAHRQETFVAGQAAHSRCRARAAVPPAADKQQDAAIMRPLSASRRVGARDQQVLRERAVPAADAADQVHDRRQQHDAARPAGKARRSGDGP